MNRKIPITFFPPGMLKSYSEEYLSMSRICFQIWDRTINYDFHIPVVADKGQEFVIRINEDGATLEICKRDTNVLSSPQADAPASG